MTPTEYLQREDNDKESLKSWLEEIKQFGINQKARDCLVMLDAILRMKAREQQTVFLIDKQITKDQLDAYLRGMKVTTEIIKSVLAPPKANKEEKDDAFA